MQSAITEPQDATYQQLRRWGGWGRRRNPPVLLRLHNAPSLLFYLLLLPVCSHSPQLLYPQDDYFLYTHQTLKCFSLSLSHSFSLIYAIKMIHFLHLCDFYFLTFIWLFVIRLQPVFGRFDNRSVNLSCGAQQSSIISASLIPSGAAERCGINASIPPVMANPYVIGNEQLM